MPRSILRYYPNVGGGAESPSLPPVPTHMANIQGGGEKSYLQHSISEHTEPLLKAYGLLKVQDIMYINLLKFYYNLSYSLLSPYFHTYFMLLNDITDIHQLYNRTSWTTQHTLLSDHLPIITTINIRHDYNNTDGL